MSEFGQKTEKGPVNLVNIHSSGKNIAVVDGKNVFLGNGIPGEEVIFVTQRKKQGFRTGNITQIITASPYRISPFCIHHKDCGGCPWQHMEYEHQLKLKHEILVNALKKYQIDIPVVPHVIPSPGLHFYRHRVEYAFSGPDMIGFHHPDDPARISNVMECYLQPALSRRICEFIRIYAKWHNLEHYDRKSGSGFLRSLSIRINRSGKALVVLGLHEDLPAVREDLIHNMKKRFREIISLNYTIHLSPSHSQIQGEIIPAPGNEPFIEESIGDYRFRIHATSFFQPNVAQAENIFSAIADWAGLSGSEKVVDLYCGVGTISHFLSSGADHVIGIEGSGQAVEDARFNAKMNKITNADFILGDILRTFTPEFIRQHGKPDVICLDPPRSGTLIEIKKTINLSGAKKVIYLSCNPVSLAFDLKQLSEKYQVTRIQPFDMIPHTHHLETLVLLEKKR